MVEHVREIRLEFLFDPEDGHLMFSADRNKIIRPIDELCPVSWNAAAGPDLGFEVVLDEVYDDQGGLHGFASNLGYSQTSLRPGYHLRVSQAVERQVYEVDSVRVVAPGPQVASINSAQSALDRFAPRWWVGSGLAVLVIKAKGEDWQCKEETPSSKVEVF